MFTHDEITVELIDKKIGEFYRENGDSENILNMLFAHADNSDFENIFCRVACIDSVYSTQIQRFNKNGIYTVSKHIQKNANRIEESFLKEEPDFDLYRELINVRFDMGQKGQDADKKTKKLYSFTSKFLSFSRPNVYPIMDSKVKSIIGFHSSDYEKYYKKICEEREKYCKELEIELTLKQWDMFLWQWAKKKDKN